MSVQIYQYPLRPAFLRQQEGGIFLFAYFLAAIFAENAIFLQRRSAIPAKPRCIFFGFFVLRALIWNMFWCGIDPFCIRAVCGYVLVPLCFVLNWRVGVWIMIACEGFTNNAITIFLIGYPL